MIILGIHFGHDSSLTLLKNGKIISCLELERIRRIKHSIGIKSEDIIYFLKQNSFKIEDIDFCAITSSQGIESVFIDKKKLKFELDFEKINSLKINKIYENSQKTSSKYLQFVKLNNSKHPYINRLDNKFKTKKKLDSFQSIEDFFLNSKWIQHNELKKINKNFYFNSTKDFIQNSMSLPIKVNILKREIKGKIYSHHFAHAAYAFYSSNFKNSIVFTQDGSLPRTSYWGGMCYLGKGKSIVPVLPHFLNLGKLYEQVSELIGFDSQSGPGKMMGLAPYGKASLFDKKLVGNIVDLEKLDINIHNKIFKYLKTKDIYSKNFIGLILNKALKKKYNFNDLGKKNKILRRINIDIAASTQKWLEETLVEALKKTKNIFLKNKLKGAENLCLSGGTFLNCPANSKIYNKKLFKKIFIPPAVHDGGLSIGACLAAYYNDYSFKRQLIDNNNSNFSYLGVKNHSNYSKHLKKLKKLKVVDSEKFIAQELSKNKVVAIFHGKSEIGPRALGHRSILANPKFKDTWIRVNKIKSRENWRPFAPIVLYNKVSEWFSDCPKVSPFMLFTANVSKPKIIPAVTHVDKSSRIQSVNKNVKPIYKILKEFYQITKIPVLLNTSFNGPGEPIVEKMEEAVNFFKNSELDYLFVNGAVFKKK